MTTATTINEYKLVRVFDLREYDWDREEYIPLDKGEGNICERCGREHAKVYVVEDTATGKQHFVGSTCSKKMFGWEPEKAELQAASKAMKEEQKRLAREKYIKTVAMPIAESILAMEMPAITCKKERRQCNSTLALDGYRIACGDVSYWFETDTLKECQYVERRWLENKIDQAVKERYSREQYKQGWKLEEELKAIILK